MRAAWSVVLGVRVRDASARRPLRRAIRSAYDLVHAGFAIPIGVVPVLVRASPPARRARGPDQAGRPSGRTGGRAGWGMVLGILGLPAWRPPRDPVAVSAAQLCGRPEGAAELTAWRRRGWEWEREVSSTLALVFEIGSSLREARTRQGLDFNEMESRTKVRAKYLRALEEEQFDQLPGHTYMKGFLRIYADASGLDGRLYVDEYNSRYITGDDDQAPPDAARHLVGTAPPTAA